MQETLCQGGDTLNASRVSRSAARATRPGLRAGKLYWTVGVLDLRLTLGHPVARRGQSCTAARILAVFLIGRLRVRVGNSGGSGVRGGFLFAYVIPLQPFIKGNYRKQISGTFAGLKMRLPGGPCVWGPRSRVVSILVCLCFWQ